MAIGAVAMLELLRRLLVLEGSDRGLAADAVTDHLGVLSGEEVRVVSLVLAWLAVGESDLEAIEAELHAMAELGEAGLLGDDTLRLVGSIRRSELTGSALEHFDYLMGLQS